MDKNEINPLDLWQMLRRRRGIVSAVASLTVAAGLAYALLTTPVYKAEAFLLPPTESDVLGFAPRLMMQGLYKQGLNEQGYTQERVYDLFIQNLRSRAERWRYFEEKKLMDILAPDRESRAVVNQVFEGGFNNALSVSRDVKDKASVQVAFEGTDARLAAAWVNGFVAQANADTVNTLIQDVTSKLENRKQELHSKIEAKRKFAAMIANDRIAALDEAILVAESLNLKEDAFSSMDGEARAASISSNMPLYMRGGNALRAERDVLKKRKNNDPFIIGLRDLEREISFLDGVHLDPSHLSAMRVDQEAFVPIHRIKPNRKMIMLLTLFGGLMLGVFAALLAEFLDKARREKPKVAASA